MEWNCWDEHKGIASANRITRKGPAQVLGVGPKPSSSPLASSCHLGATKVPDHAQRIEAIQPLVGHRRLPAKSEQVVLSALALDPYTQCRVPVIFRRHVAVPVLPMEFNELGVPLFPDQPVRIPNEAESVQCLDSIFCQGRMLPCKLDLELISLTLDPLRQRWVFARAHKAMPVPLVILLQFLES
eukprot:CAMPEP_0198132182 /NCGR_PEP_ID=MMETSP1442-20131203/57736_1 /TAXON_ID= /ORGANISM="Craspedostauros australis, Strain CCMP3328" /LENGTH=184 /DNA_ID=CAMNT_0043793123 /DNA_START=52 /DNA_END=602 /DNA_ORIENTATION=-